MAQQSQMEDIELSEKNLGTSSTILLPLSETPTLKPSDLEKNPPKPKPESLWSKIGHWIRRYKVALFITFLVLLIVGGLVGMMVPSILKEKRSNAVWEEWIGRKWEEAKQDPDLAANGTTPTTTTAPAPAITCVSADDNCSN